MSILESTFTRFNSLSPYEYSYNDTSRTGFSYWRIVDCSMDNGYAKTDTSKIGPLLDKLNQGAAEGIKFDAKHLDYHLSGGVCSAHSLTFIRDYLQSDINLLHRRVVTVAQRFRRSSLDLRTYQVALNTISKAQDEPPTDFMKAKAESLASLHDLKIDYASKGELLVEDDNYGQKDVNRSEFYNAVEALPEGIFLVRAIAKENNFRGEYYGHSMVYINDSVGHYFFDPGDGCSQISNGRVKEALWNLVGDPSSAWGIKLSTFLSYKTKR